MNLITVTTDKKGNKFFVISFDYHPKLVEFVKKIPLRKFDPITKNWNVRVDHQVIKYVDIFAKYFDFDVSDEAQKIIEKFNAPSGDEELPTLKMKLYPFQKEGVLKAIRFERCLLADEMGLGKAQSIYSKILTPRGYKLFKDVSVGNEIMGPSGGIFNILGVYPQGIKPLYKITFSDGASTISCNEHLWSVQTALQKHRHSKYLIKNLESIRNDLIKPGKNRKNLKWFIPITNALQFKNENTDFYIHPYILGVLIGDGCLSHGARFTSEDDEVVIEVRKNIRPGFILKKKGKNDFDILNEKNTNGICNFPNKYIRELKKLLLNTRSEHKFIPDCYKFSSISDRMELLRGLMDTDGYVSKSGDCIQYYTVSEKLKNDIVFLLQSLGCVVRVSLKKTKFKHKGITKRGQDCYTLTVNLPNNFFPFKLKRKLYRIKANRKYLPCRGIKSIEYIGEGEAICIKTTSPDSLYITDECIVTHNTPEAIASIEKLNAYPCLIVTPASTKLNWQREINSWVDRTSIIISGGKEAEDYTAECIIINYDILEKHLKNLQSVNFKSIIFDESHMIKNHKTKRTIALKKLAKNIRYRFALTGTPLLNKPKELMPQLDALDRLDSFGGFWSFAKRYCGAEEVDLPDGRKFWNFGNISNLGELNTKLVEFCMIRRLKKDVLKELPPKQRTLLPIEIDNRSEYNIAAKNFRKWVKNTLINPEEYKEEIKNSPNLTESQKRLVLESKIQTKLNQTLSAEALVKIEYLKQLAVRGKMAKAIDFIDNALEQGVKLLVFATHREIQNELWQTYKDKNAARIFADDNIDVRQVNIDKFQTDETCRLMMASLKAGGVGINLTKSSTVIFIEFGWTPAEHEQAEDRVHRIGQADFVNCYYLFGKDTIDEAILDLIERKRSIAQAVIDGKEPPKSLDNVEEILKTFI